MLTHTPGVLLPLTYENNYKPEVVLCGGSELPDTLKENEVSSQSPTSQHCARIALDAAGIAAGWSSELMPEGRGESRVPGRGTVADRAPRGLVMLDAAILPDGKILIVNGAKTGTAGYGNVPDQVSLFCLCWVRSVRLRREQIGSSNADNPAFTPVLYDPAAPAGSRFNSTGMPTSNIARLYHSVS
jgi:hypothetical protein